MLDGDENAGIFTIGQIIGGITDVPTCKELIERTVIEAEKALETTQNTVLAK